MCIKLVTWKKRRWIICTHKKYFIIYETRNAAIFLAVLTRTINCACHIGEFCCCCLCLLVRSLCYRQKPNLIRMYLHTKHEITRQTRGTFVQPLLLWKSNKYYILWVCVCSLRYPAGNAHASCCHLCPASALQYFSTLSHKRQNFRVIKLLNTKCVFWLSLQLLSETFLILRRNERDMVINAYWYSCKVPFILVRF